MIYQNLQDIHTLAKNRIQFLREYWDGNFFKWSSTFFDGILEEMNEVREELISWKQIYLEDELGDVFWDYICLLETLQKEWKIDVSNVFKRCYIKYSERLNLNGSNKGDWKQVKKEQKQRLELEQQNLLT